VIHDGSDEVEAAFAAFGERASCNSPSSANPEGSILGGRRSQGAIYPGDTGTASRFFFSAKADASDRAGSKHPTVKPTVLMRYLVRLVTPPGGTVLDPFAGSGSTGLAADQLGMNAVLIERDPEYAADIERKITSDAPLLAEVITA
jgi:site-specific DNA-methyltransferase (adenine-specific)